MQIVAPKIREIQRVQVHEGTLHVGITSEAIHVKGYYASILSVKSVLTEMCY